MTPISNAYGPETTALETGDHFGSGAITCIIFFVVSIITEYRRIIECFKAVVRTTEPMYKV